MIPKLERGDVVIEFKSDDVETGSLPSRIIVPDSWIEDFFAWSSTYVETLSPLTAFIDVWSADEALQSRQPIDLTTRQKGALVGAALMDALLQSRSRMRVPDNILSASLRTLSAVFVQTINAGSARREISDAATAWTAIRGNLQSAELPFDSTVVLSFWAHVLPIFNPQGVPADPELIQVFHSFFSEPAKENPWRLSKYGSELSINVEQVLQLPREERIRLADDQLGRISASRVSADVKGALAGYLLSVVGDGDFSLWPTATDFGTLRSMPLWFGFFSGGWERSNVLNISQSIGRRLLSQLEFRPGDVDIDAREFVVSRRIRTKPNAPVDFPPSTYNVLKAKLAPYVCGWFSIREASSASREAPPEQRPPTVTSVDGLSQDQFRVLKDAVERLYTIMSNLSLVMPSSAGRRADQLELGDQIKAGRPRKKKK